MVANHPSHASQRHSHSVPALPPFVHRERVNDQLIQTISVALRGSIRMHQIRGWWIYRMVYHYHGIIMVLSAGEFMVLKSWFTIIYGWFH